MSAQNRRVLRKKACRKSRNCPVRLHSVKKRMRRVGEYNQIVRRTGPGKEYLSDFGSLARIGPKARRSHTSFACAGHDVPSVKHVGKMRADKGLFCGFVIGYVTITKKSSFSFCFNRFCRKAKAFLGLWIRIRLNHFLEKTVLCPDSCKLGNRE